MPRVRIVHDAQLWYVAQSAGRASLRFARRRCFPPPRRSNAAAATARIITPTYPPARLALRHVADLYVYPNGLRVVRGDRGDGARVVGALGERVPARSTRTRRRRSRCSTPNFAAYDFDSIAGVTYRLDLTRSRRATTTRGVSSRRTRAGSSISASRAADRRGGDLSRRHQLLSRQRRRPFSRLRRSLDRLRGARFQFRGAVAVRKKSADGQGQRGRRLAVGALARFGHRDAAGAACRRRSSRCRPASRVAPLGPGPQGFFSFRVTPRG